MKELSEEDMQHLLEQQLNEDGKQLPADDKDIALYKILFTALTDEPGTLQGINLAEAVVKQIKIKEQKAETLRYNLIIAAVLVAGILSVYFSINYISPATLNAALNFLFTYKWIFLFIIFCFSFIEIADKNLVKRKLIES